MSESIFSGTWLYRDGEYRRVEPPAQEFHVVMVDPTPDWPKIIAGFAELTEALRGCAEAILAASMELANLAPILEEATKLVNREPGA